MKLLGDNLISGEWRSAFSEWVAAALCAESSITRRNALKFLMEDTPNDQTESDESPFVVCVFSRPEVFVVRHIRAKRMFSLDEISAGFDYWVEFSESALILEKKFKGIFRLFSEECEVSAKEVFGSECVILNLKKNEPLSKIERRIFSVYLALVNCIESDFPRARSLYDELNSRVDLRGGDFWGILTNELAYSALKEFRNLDADFLSISDINKKEKQWSDKNASFDENSFLSAALEESHREVEALAEKLSFARNEYEIKIKDLENRLSEEALSRIALEFNNKRLVSESCELKYKLNKAESGFEYRCNENEEKASDKVRQAEAEKVLLEREIDILQKNSETIQIELENALLDYSKNSIGFSQALDRASELEALWKKFRPDDIWIDLRTEKVGRDWYPAESDGRWTGPGEVSLVSVPPLAVGMYRIEFEVVDCVDLNRISELRVSLNQGNYVSAEIEWLSNVVGEYPCIACASVQVLDDSDFLSVTLFVPFVQRPHVSFSDDLRALGVRVKTLRLTKLYS